MKPLLVCLVLIGNPVLAQGLSQEPVEPIPTVVVEQTAGPFTSGLAVVLGLFALLLISSKG